MAVRWPGQANPGSDESEDAASAAGPSPIDWLSYVACGVWRRRTVAGAVFAGCVVALVVYYRAQVPLYRVETRILAQRQQALPSIGRPTAQDDDPTRAAWEIVHRRENLLALVQQAELLKKPGLVKESRSIRERLSGLLGRSGSSGNPEEDRVQGMVNRLGRELLVTVTEGTITISIDWPDPDQAYRLVEAALQNFLESRHLQEVTAMDEAISLLQGRTAMLRDQLDKVIEQARSDAYRRAGDAPRPGRAPGKPSEEAVQIKSMLDAKERAVADVEEFRRRRLSDLQAQLDAQKAVYSEAHPIIIALRRDIEALAKESPQVAGLRGEIRKLRAEYAARTGHPAEPRPLAAPAPPTAGSIMESEQVRQARFQFQQMVERVNAAQLDLDAARAAFKYRYSVVWPAQLPRKPVSPSVVKILGLGTVASFLLAVLVAMGLELRAGLVVARWQVEHSLDLVTLGEIGGKD